MNVAVGDGGAGGSVAVGDGATELGVTVGRTRAAALEGERAITGRRVGDGTAGEEARGAAGRAVGRGDGGAEAGVAGVDSGAEGVPVRS